MTTPNNTPTPRTDEAKAKASHRILLHCAGRSIPNQFSIEDIIAEEFGKLERELVEALKLIRDATDGALDESGLKEAVIILISQRDNAREMYKSVNTRAEQAEAACAVKDEALKDWMDWFTGNKDSIGAPYIKTEQALSPNCGQSLLDELSKLKAENTEIRSAFDSLKGSVDGEAHLKIENTKLRELVDKLTGTLNGLKLALCNDGVRIQTNNIASDVVCGEAFILADKTLSAVEAFKNKENQDK